MARQGHQKYLNEHPELSQDARERIQRKIKALSILSPMAKEERLELFNSAMFNDVVNGYVKMALDNLKLSEEAQRGILQELKCLFDTVTAEQAEDYYKKH